jgi:glycine oxidase
MLAAPSGALGRAGTLGVVGSKRAVVVGAGAIGLTSAWALHRAGYEIVAVDPTPGRGAVWQSGGMLAPVCESHFGEEALVALLGAGWRCWEETAPVLSAEVGDVGYRTCGTLMVALDQGDRAELTRRGELMASLGLRVAELDRTELRDLEPNLTAHARSALFAPDDHQVDNRALVEGLLGYLRRNGSLVLRRATSVAPGRCSVEGGEVIEADVVVLCPGAHLSQIEGVESGRLPVVRPVKGHVLRLAGAPLLSRTVRAVVHGRPVYLVPRQEGELVVGATVEEVGFDLTVRAGEVHRLLDDARLVVPGIDELELREATAGLRPGSPDNAPTVSELEPGLIAAVGHFRNGVLLAPITAAAVVALAEGARHPSMGLFEAAHR